MAAINVIVEGDIAVLKAGNRCMHQVKMKLPFTPQLKTKLQSLLKGSWMGTMQF